MVKPIFPYTGTQTEHSQPWRGFILAAEDFHVPATKPWHRGTVPRGAAARAQTEKGSRLRGEANGKEDRAQMTLELTYGCTVRPGLLVQASLQYLVNPGGDKAVPNALALGLNVVFNF
jgi:hypothetical protein